MWPSSVWVCFSAGATEDADAADDSKVGDAADDSMAAANESQMSQDLTMDSVKIHLR